MFFQSQDQNSHSLLLSSCNIVKLLPVCQMEIVRQIVRIQNCLHVRGERIVFSGPNMNTNTIRVHKFDRIQILFVVFIKTEYESEYYSGSEI